MKLVVENVWTYVQGGAPWSIIDDVTSYRVHGRWFAQAWRRGHWDGVKRFREHDKKTGLERFPTGFVNRVCKLLDKLDYPYELDDQRVLESPDPVYQLNGARLDEGLYAFQQGVLDTALMHGRGVIHAATGSGKTEIAAALVASYDLPTVFLTHRKALLYQTHARFEKRLEREIGIVGDGLCDVRQITVAMVQTVAKKKSVKIKRMLDQAQVVIGDEIHHLESSSWYSTFACCQAPYRFGLTATPCTDGAGMYLVSMTGEIIVKVTAGELIERGVLVQPKIWFTRVPGASEIEKKAPYATVYAQGVVRSTARNTQILHVARILKAEGKSCITLVRRINHGNLLADLFSRTGVRTEFIHGNTSNEMRALYLDQLWRGELDHVVAQAEVLGEGVDMPELRAVINATGTKGGGSKSSSVEHEVGRGTVQFLGRGLRRAPGKDEFEFFDIRDLSHKFLAQAARERVKTLEEEGYAPWIKYFSERPVALEVSDG